MYSWKTAQKEIIGMFNKTVTNFIIFVNINISTFDSFLILYLGYLHKILWIHSKQTQQWDSTKEGNLRKKIFMKKEKFQELEPSRLFLLFENKAKNRLNLEIPLSADKKTPKVK